MHNLSATRGALKRAVRFSKMGQMRPLCYLILSSVVAEEDFSCRSGLIKGRNEKGPRVFPPRGAGESNLSPVGPLLSPPPTESLFLSLFLRRGDPREAEAHPICEGPWGSNERTNSPVELF